MKKDKKNNKEIDCKDNDWDFLWLIILCSIFSDKPLFSKDDNKE